MAVTIWPGVFEGVTAVSCVAPATCGIVGKRTFADAVFACTAPSPPDTRAASPAYRRSVIELGLRNDVYRRPLMTALDRLGLREGWKCVDVGAGGGDVSVALAEVVGHDGRVYAVDSDPGARDAVATAAAAHSQIVAITQAAEELLLPEAVDLAFCRFLLMHVHQPLVALRRMGQAVRASGWVVAQEPVTSAGRVDGRPLSMPDARHPDVGALLPALARDAGLEIVDAWAESQAGAGPGPVRDYLAHLTDVDPGDDPVVLPPLVTVVARRPATS